MIDLAQFLLVIVIVVLTGLLVIIGIQVVNILKEFRRSLEKINKILDDAGIISGSVAKPMADFSGFFEGVKGGFKLIELVVDFLRNKNKKKQLKTEQQEQPPEEEKQEKPSSRRFFFKKGKKLG